MKYWAKILELNTIWCRQVGSTERSSEQIYLWLIAVPFNSINFVYFKHFRVEELSNNAFLANKNYHQLINQPLDPLCPLSGHLFMCIRFIPV